MLDHVVERKTLRLLVVSDNAVPDMTRGEVLCCQLAPILQSALRPCQSDVSLILFVGRCKSNVGEDTLRFRGPYHVSLALCAVAVGLLHVERASQADAIFSLARLVL